MIGRRVILKRGSRDDAEKPFWISFADLMTALMVLFLVSLSVALVRAQDETAKAKQAQEELARAKAELERREMERDTRREQREAAISECHHQLEKLIAEFNGAKVDGVRLDRARNVIDFGSRARFERMSHELTFDQAIALRSFTLGFLSVLRKSSDVCRAWLKRVVVEGFTDKTGSYLVNLNLSLNRSQRVMCVLLSGEYASASRAPGSTSPLGMQSATGAFRRDAVQLLEPISSADETFIKQLFLIGGYSSNSLKSTDEESRRIELRIEFYQVDEERALPDPADSATGHCAIRGR
jgi:outer membrane protein OmpA-like peptidoglycan-associated protein